MTVGRELLLGIGLLVCAGRISAASAHVRGADYSGRASEARLQLPWPAEGPRILWRRHLGDGFSGMVLEDGRIFTQMQTMAGQFVVCLDRVSGRERWRTRTNWPWQPGGSWPGPYATPTVAGGRVFFADCFGRVGCLEAETGRVRWSVDLARQFGAELPGFGYAATPLVEHGKVYLPAGGDGRAVIALDAADGSLEWQAGDGAASYSSCVLLKVAGRSVVMTFLENGPLALDPGSGRELWQHRWPRASDHHGTWPLYAESLLFYGLPFRAGAEVHRLVRDGDGVRAERVWASGVLSLDILSGVVLDGHVYAFDVHDFESGLAGRTNGVLKCVELATGRECWRSTQTGHCSVVAAGSHLVMLNEVGELMVAKATPAGYRELARVRLLRGGGSWAPITIADGLLLARGGNEIVAISLQAGAEPGLVGGEQSSPEGTPFSNWFARYYQSSWAVPTGTEHMEWFLACVVGVLLPVGAVAAFLPRHQWAAWSVWLAGALALAVGATFLFTTLSGRFLFTWPAGIFLGLAGVVGCRAWAGENPSPVRRWCARAGLAAFGVAVLGYWLVCRSVFFFAGAGWLAGLLPALPLTLAAVAMVRRNGVSWKSAAWALAGFGLFFFTGSLVVWWRSTG